MPSIAELRAARPRLKDLSDEEVVDIVSQDYPEIPRDQIAKDLGVTLPLKDPGSRTLGTVAKDLGVSVMSGLAGIPEAAVGLADIATGGRAGKAVADAGIDFKGAHDYWRDKYSDPQKAAFKEVEDAKGFLPTLGAAVSNPSVILHSAVESLPSMAAGGLAGRAALAVGGRAVSAAAGGMGPALPGVLERAAGAAAPLIAGAAGEGLTMAGQNAEQIRQETPDGLLTAGQAAAAAGIGVAGGALSLLGGKVAQKLGIADIDTAIAAGKLNQQAGKGLVRRVLEGALSEGALEELPQSIMEQVVQNAALGKPLDEGVDHAAVLGLLTGGAMGGAANVMHGSREPEAKRAPGAPAPAAPTPGAPPALPAPESVISVDPQGNATPGYRRIFSGDAVDVPFREVGPLERASGAATGGTTGMDPAGAAQGIRDAIATLVEDEKTNRPDPDKVIERMHNQAARDLQAIREFDSGHAPGDVQPGDITRNGKPFKSKGAALSAVDAETKGGVVAVQGGFVFRPIEVGGAQNASKPGGGDQTVDVRATMKRHSGADGRMDAGKAADDLVAQAQAALDAGRTVTLHADGKPVQITSIARGMMQDAKGQRWGAMSLFTDPDGKLGNRLVFGSSSSAVDEAAHQAATSPRNDLPEPTAAQKEAGNYKKGHIQLHGLDITVENPQGSERSGKRPDGSEWRHTMSDHYGYIKRTIGADEEQVDTYVGPQHDAGEVYVVDQIHQDTGTFDEHKVMLGYPSQADAIAAYASNFDKDWEVGPVTPMSVDDFKAWLKTGDLKRPIAGVGDQRQVKPRSLTPRQQAALPKESNDEGQNAAPASDATLGATAAGDGADGAQPGQGADAGSVAGGRGKARAPRAKKGRAADASSEGVAGERDAVDEDWSQTVADLHDEQVKMLYKASKLGKARDIGKMRDQLARSEDEVYDTYDRLSEENDFTQWNQEDAEDRFELGETWDDYEVASFPDPGKTVDMTKAAEFITTEEAAARLAEWKAEAARQGREEDHSNEVVISLFDASGEISKPWREAGYDVQQFDMQLGDDLFKYVPIGRIEEYLKETGKTVKAFLAQPPCTTFTSTGAQWRDTHHDINDRKMVNKMFGPYAAQWFSKPHEYSKALVSIVDMMIGELLAKNPNMVFVMENPNGGAGRTRLPGTMGLPRETLAIQPNLFGDPYTKKTLLWGKFNTDLPTAPVEATQGSLMHKLWSRAEKNGGLRSLTPEGFSYAFFMANSKTAAQASTAQSAAAAPAPDAGDKRLAELQARDKQLVEEWNMASRRLKAAKDETAKKAIKAGMDQIDADLKEVRAAILGDAKRQIQKASDAAQAKEAEAMAARPVGTRMRPSEHAEESGLGWEKTANNEWTGYGDWFQKGKTRTDADMAKHGGFLEVKAQPAANSEPWRDSPFAARIERVLANLEAGGERAKDMRKALLAGFNMDAKVGTLTEDKVAFREQKAREALAADGGAKPIVPAALTSEALAAEDVTIAALPVELRDAAVAKLNPLMKGLGALGFASEHEVNAASPQPAQDIARQIRDIKQSLMLLAPARFRVARGYKTSNPEKLAEFEREASRLLGIDTTKYPDVDQSKVLTSSGERQQPAPRPKPATANKGAERKLRQAWPVDGIDGYTEMPGQKPEQTDSGIKNGVKDAFLSDAREYLRAVSLELQERGFRRPADEKRKIVSVNEGGPAVAGDVHLEMRGPTDADGSVRIQVGASFSEPNRASIMLQRMRGNTFVGGNQFPSSSATAGELAGIIARQFGASAPTDSDEQPALKPKAEAKPEKGATNTVFTADAAAKARALLKAKLSTPMSGIDPELMQAGITLAGFHIEAGARSFGTYAKAMLADLGEAVRPYLKSWYMAVAFDPRAGDMQKDMSTPAFVQEFDVAAVDIPQEVDTSYTPPVETQPETDHTENEAPDANPVPTDRVPAGGEEGNPVDATAGDRDSQPLADGVAGPGEQPAGGAEVPAGPRAAGGGRKTSPRGTRKQAPRPARDSLSLWSEPGTSDAVNGDPATAPVSDKPTLDADFNLEGEDIGKGGLAQKYRDNLAAIKILKALDDEGRRATPDERRAIARYVGWGALKGVFDEGNAKFAKQREELKALLTEAEWKAAKASTLNAHYTSKDVVGAMFAGLDCLGFKHGRILEPSVGVGNFFGLMPEDMRKASRLHGVELDPLTSKIVAALYPSAKIARATGFEDFQIPGEFFDLAIGNPPFGSEPLVDMDRTAYSGFSIHNYFFAKSIDKLRPGGLLAMVVSHNFLDAQNDAARKWISERANLLAAVRLPNTAFKENAGTEVVTDIVFFQKRAAGENVDNTTWLRTVPQPNVNPKTGETVVHQVNAYFKAHPEHVLGTPSAAGTMYGANEYTVEPSGELAQQLSEWIGKGLPEGVFQPIERTSEDDAADVVIPDGVKVGSYFVHEDGTIHTRGPDALGKQTSSAWTPPNAKAEQRMRGMIGLRDVLRDQMRMERSTTATEAEVEAGRAKLNALYDEFKGKYGYLNDGVNRRLFLDDTEAPLVQMLEFDYDKGISAAVSEKEGIPERPASARKADIFAMRVAFPPAENIVATSAKDALLASLNYKGGLDLAYMAQVYGKSAEEIVEELGDVVFRDPMHGHVTADEYLSGDVKTKLAEAKAALPGDSSMRRNIEALEKVIPKDKMPSEIHASLGAMFVPEDVYNEFAQHVSGMQAKARFLKATGQWLVEFSGQSDPVKNVAQWGTKDVPANEIMNKTMLGQTVIVKETVRNPDGSTTTYVKEKETEAAREKQRAMKDEWQKWLWSDPERADRIAAIFNEKMNRLVDRAYDGSHLTFPGMSPAIELLEHQKNGVWRGLQSRQLLLDHVVGAGKTYQMAAIVMEMRRLGIARKPLLAVPNHLTLQWRDEFARLYPGSKVLAATPDDFAKGARERFFSKIVTGDWDAIIIGHSSLKKIGLPLETEKAVLQEQVDELSQAIEEMKRERGDRNILRDMEGIKKRLEAKMKERLSNLGQRDKVLTFDELGLDALLVDELHEFKNLFYNSTMERNPGMGNPTGSGKAFDLFVKVRWLFDTFGDQAPLITATGTPVSNSLVEMFNMQRLMQYPMLKEEGIHTFDAWANNFGSVESLYEVSPSGTGYRTASRFAKFKNLPALMAHYSKFADTITLDDLKAQEAAAGRRFPVPKLKTGRPMLVVAKRSPAVADFMGVPHLSRGPEGNVLFDINLSGDAEVEVLEAGEGMFGILYWPQGKGEGAQAVNLGKYATREQANLVVVQKALTPKIEVDPQSILGQFQNLKQLTRDSKGKINALSITGLANKAGLDYRLIDPAAPDFPSSKINLAVKNMVKLWKDTAADKATQLVFCDLSIPVSARSTFGSKPRALYVRDEDGAVVRKRGTMHTVEGREQFPFFLIGGKDKPFQIYDAASGMVVHRAGFDSKDAAKAWVADTLENEASREKWLEAREARGDIEQEEIDEYNDANEVDTEETEYISRSDIAGMSGATKFSVYDDIKAKLIRAGVPEGQIAFIHDYATPTAKAKLFARMNAGDVRFLFGSTPKLGAGTNVQRRLVGLHHIDAPWRPSDLEQREGRIIRRGNLFYEQDPDGFEVSVWRYATEQTYDTRRWQILEHKARVIEQLRNFDGTTNEIEDVDGEAASAADMKAAASGDPLILEETKLRTEVKRLEHLRASHVDSTAAMRRRAIGARDFATRQGPAEIEEYQRLIAITEQHPVPAKPEKADKDAPAPIASFKVDGQLQATREAAVQAISRAVTRTMSGMVTSTSFEYRGMTFRLEHDFKDSYRLVSPSGMSMDVFRQSEAVSSSGLLTRFANWIDRLPAHVEAVKSEIAKQARDAEGLLAESQKPFTEAELLEETKVAYRKVQRQLIAKGPEVPAVERPLLARALKEQRATLEAEGYGDALAEFAGSTHTVEPAGPSIAQGGDPIANTTDVVFRQAEATSILPADAEKVGKLQAVADAVREGWRNTPDVIVVQSVASRAVPAAVRQEARDLIANGGNVPSGVLYGGHVYLFADRISNEADAVRVLYHEVLGHVGLRGRFGEDLDAILRQIASARPADIANIIRRNGFKEDDRLRAAEEFLAEMAEKHPELGFVRRAIAAVRSFLRAALPKVFGKLELTDDEIIRSFILPARGWIHGGGPRGGRKGAPGALSTQLATAFSQPGTAFDKWFGNSKVVDAEGKPLVVYHGTNQDFDEFRIGWNQMGDGEQMLGIFFGNKEAADTAAGRTNGAGASDNGDIIMPAYLRMVNPLRVKLDAKHWHSPERVIEAIASSGLNVTTLRQQVRMHEARKPVYTRRYPGTIASFDVENDTVAEVIRPWLVAKGYDGVIYPNTVDGDADGSPSYIVFSPEQIKSAIGNRGTYDRNSRNIMFSQGGAAAGVNDPRDYWKQALGIVDELANSPGKLNFWQKTFGTPYDLAQRYPAFKLVYDKIQTFLRDVSLYATEAADLAPSILPKLDSWRDAFKQPLSAKDTKAIAKPIFEGTLLYTRDQYGEPIKTREVDEPGGPAEGVVWTDAELREMFGLDERQIGLYHEARAAIDRSLTNLVLADMVRYAGIDARPIADVVMEAGDLRTGSALLAKYLESLAKEDSERGDILRQTASVIRAKAARGMDLIAHGYAPLSRFGTHVVDVVDGDGNRVYFGLFESRMEARDQAERMAKLFPGASITRGTTSQEEYKMFAGLSPETIELFGEMLGLETGGDRGQDKAFQEFLKQARSSRSAMKRLIHRKGIMGFSEDVGRVLAGFVYSNARQTSSSIHSKEIAEHVTNIPQGQGELKDMAVKLMKYTMEPQEEAVALRGVLFAQYLGGSAAAMLVNMTQPFAVTAPYLTQFASVGKVAGYMKGALRDVWKESTGDARLDKALRHAADAGIVAPQEVHQLMKQAQGKASLVASDGTALGRLKSEANNLLSRAALLWGQPFAVAELFNRRLTFIAAYRLAVENNVENPAEFAEKAITDTQFTYNKGNKPAWARGAVGSVLFTFKQYSISYLELAHRMYSQGGPEGKKAALLMVAMLMLMGGAGGLPFMEDVSDLIDGIGQRLGYNLRTKRARQEFLEGLLGKHLGGFIDKGVTGIPGMPIDVAARFGMGNLIPGTGLLTVKKDHTQDVVEVLGPAGDLARRTFEGANQAARGDVVKGVLTASPTAARNLAKAYEMAVLGYYTDSKGKKTIDTDGYDAFAKLVGFQPHAVAQDAEARRDVQQLIEVAKAKESEIADRWADAVFKRDEQATQSAKAELAAWNRNNPESPIRITQAQITRRVRDMRKTKAQRLEATAPKEIRARVRQELSRGGE